MLVKVYSFDRQNEVEVELEGISEEQFKLISNTLVTGLEREEKAYNAVGQAMLTAINLCPNANPADLWVHVIYHEFRETAKRSDQSWKRVSGDAFQLVVTPGIYKARLEIYDITLRASRPNDAKLLGLADAGFGNSKTDLILEGLHKDTPKIFGAIHCKASIAERFADDMPASKFLLSKGYWSGAATLDCKMFPPPHGNAIVRGELQITKNNDKRRYIEVNGAFSNCYSFNTRTPQSAVSTPSGAKIYSLSFSQEQPDQFVTDIVTFWNSYKESL